MGEDVPTGLGVLQQEPPSGSTVIGAAARLRALSSQFGWPILLVFAVVPAEARAHTLDHWAYFALGVPAILLGVMLRVWSRGFAREEGFVYDGPYRYVRNPVELGAVIAYAGAGTVFGLTWWANVAVVALTLVYLSFVAISYERDLYRRAGAPYLRYAQRVRRWLPQQFPAANRSNMTYSLRSSLWRERESVLWLIGYGAVFALRMRADGLLPNLH
jgi:protein-S-isoprenylcysteine O-methyltransferase Ste14